LSHKYAAVQAKEVIEMMLIATADEILRKGLEMVGFDLRPKRNGINLKLIVKFKWRRRKKEERKQHKQQEIDSIASGFCILSLYWLFGYDRVVLVSD
jgi:hypothetical protein